MKILFGSGIYITRNPIGVIDVGRPNDLYAFLVPDGYCMEL